MSISRLSVIGIAAVLVGLSFVIYWPVLSYQFVNIDDGIYVVHNSMTQQGFSIEGWNYAWNQFVCSNWHPLTILSYQMDASIWGHHPTSYHRTNVVLHGLNVGLLFLALVVLTRNFYPSAVVAALFGLHPLHVESVAWISERKDVLSTFFLLLTLLAYTRYARQPSFGRYSIVFVLMGLGLLAKPMLVTLPVLLILLDFWPLNRFHANAPAKGTGPGRNKWIWSAVREKLPLFCLSLGDGVATVMAQSGAVDHVKGLSFGYQLANVSNAYFWYLKKTFIPVGLKAFYAHPGADVPWVTVIAGGLICCVITAIAWKLRRSKPHLLFGWGWFCVSLVPVIGLIQVGVQAYADRYVYIPHIGLFVAIVWELQSWITAVKWARLIVIPSEFAMLVACVWLTSSQLTIWANAESLWQHSLSVDPGDGHAHLLLANAIKGSADLNEVLFHLEEGIRLSNETTVPATYSLWGETLLELGRESEAEEKFKNALKLFPDHIRSLDALWNLYERQQRQEEADQIARSLMRAYRDQAGKYPFSATLQIGVGRIELQTGNPLAARACFQRAVRSSPRDVNAHFHLGLAQLSLGDLDGAKSSFQKVIDLAPTGAPAYFSMGQAFELGGERTQAEKYYAKAAELDPTNDGYRQHRDRVSQPSSAPQ